MTDLPDRIASLTPDQRRKLAGLLRSRERNGSGLVLDPGPGEQPPAIAEGAEGAERRAVPTFSIFFFAADSSKLASSKYHLVVEAARLADRLGYEAVWIPERHFDSFGGLYPSPAVVAGALATITEHLAIRAGSVVLPLQHPVRVAEEWSVIDNLSGGRAGISFASGWHPNDFVLAPGRWADRKELMFREIEIIQELWAGKAVLLPGGTGTEVETRIHPAPVQRELPVWITSTGSPQTWLRAAQMGANVLTALLEQSLEEAGEKIVLYRQELARRDIPPGSRRVTMMIHSFVGETTEEARRIVKPPMSVYLRSHMKLYEKLLRSQDMKVDVDSFSEKDKEALVDFAFERYFDSSGLFGDIEKCAARARILHETGVDEIAALIDFGVDDDLILASIERLAIVREKVHEMTLAQPRTSEGERDET